MKNKIVNSLMAGALAFGLTACSNDDNGPSNGLATFFHSVPDAGFLRMETDNNQISLFGSMNYQQFGAGIPADTGTYDLTVKDANLDDISASVELLDTRFEVYNTRERNVYALSGSARDKTVTLHHLRTAIDKDARA